MNKQLVDSAAERLQRRRSQVTPLRSDITVSFEVFPPATPSKLSELNRTAKKLATFDPEFISVTYGAGGSDQDKTFEAIDAITGAVPVSVAGHLTCVGVSKSRISEVVDSYLSVGVTRIVALRGDPPNSADRTESDIQSAGYGNAAELVAGLRSHPDGHKLDISVAAYPEVHPKAVSPEADLDALKRKLDCGADRAITQFFFDNDLYLRFLERIAKAGIDKPVVPGIMPITNYTNICRFAQRCNTSVPPWLHELFNGLDQAPEIRDLIAATVAAEQCNELVENGVQQFHFYTMNKPNLTSALCHILGVAPGVGYEASQAS